MAFVDTYMLNGFNARQAYKSVYKNTTDESADVLAHKLWSNVKVKAEIERRQEENRKKYEITKEEIVEVVKSILLNNRDEFPSHSLKAAEVLNKMFGFNLPDKQEINTSTTEDNTIKIEIIRPKDEN